MKKPDAYLKEYCQKLSDDNLKFLAGRLYQRLGGDVAEALDYLSNTREVDKWLSSAPTCNDLYDMVDAMQVVVGKECDKRGM